MKNKVLCLCFISLLFLGSAFGDTIILKSGKQIEGAIKEKTADSIKVDIEGITITYYFTDIESINGDKVSLSVPTQLTDTAVKQGETTQPASGDVTSSDIIVVIDKKNAKVETDSVSNQPVEPILNQQDDSFSKSQKINENDISSTGDNFKFKRGKLSEKDAKLAVAVAGGIFLVLIVIIIVLYVYSALCLFFIAKKTSTEPAWMAWVPIANMFLMCNIAKMSYLWLLGLLGSLIPYLSIVANIYLMGLFVYMWYKIAIARGKPGWVGILTIIPVVNLVIMGYLAFAE